MIGCMRALCLLAIALTAEAVNNIQDDTVISGYMEASTTAYPVVEGVRTKEDTSNAANEAKFASSTKSGLTASRKSTLYNKTELKAGFGSDVSFENIDKNGLRTEMGAIGMQATGDGSSAADIVFKVWNGADTKGYPGDENGAYNKMVIRGTGDVEVTGGKHQTSNTGYPVVEGVRTKEDTSNAANEAKFASSTKSGLTASRKSTLYNKAELKAGFGSDVSFENIDKSGVRTEMGVIGMQATGDGSSAADIVFKVWNGADTKGYPGDENGTYNKMVIRSNGNVEIQGDLFVNGVKLNGGTTCSCPATVTSEDDGLGAGAIVAITIGGLVLLGLIGCAVVTVKKRGSHEATTKAAAGELNL